MDNLVKRYKRLGNTEFTNFEFSSENWSRLTTGVSLLEHKRTNTSERTQERTDWRKKERGNGRTSAGTNGLTNARTNAGTDWRYLYNCFCFNVSFSSSLILFCNLSRKFLSNTKHLDKSCGIILFTTYWIWSSFNVTTTFNWLSFCCFSRYMEKIKTIMFSKKRMSYFKTFRATWRK